MNADELREIVKAVHSDQNIPRDELAEGWLHWFKKRGDRYLKDAAKLGYTEATLDLPIEIGLTFDARSLVIIQKGVKQLLESCIVSFIEDEYDGRPIARLLISWK